MYTPEKPVHPVSSYSGLRLQHSALGGANKKLGFSVTMSYDTMPYDTTAYDTMAYDTMACNKMPYNRIGTYVVVVTHFDVAT